LREREDYCEDCSLHSLGRFIEKIRPKEKAEKKKGWKRLLADAAFYSSSYVLLRLKPLTQRDDLCYHLHVVYPGRYNYSCGSVSAVFTCGEKAYIAKQKEETWIGQFNMCCGV